MDDNPFAENPFESPAGRVSSRWALPPDERPYEETVHLLRSLGGSDEVTNKELLWLAYYLNESHEARHTWPGERLVRELAEMFDHRTPGAGDREVIRGDLQAIERECARVAEPLPAEPAILASAVKVVELALPESDRKIDFYCEEVNDSFAVDLRRQQCACPTWPNGRSKLLHGDIRRCCAHMVGAYHELIEAGEISDVAPILQAVFADRERRGRSCDPNASWHLLKIKMRPYLIILRHTGWTYVYAPDGGTDFSRYAYEPEEKRWSHGQAPVNRGALVEWVERQLASAGGG